MHLELTVPAGIGVYYHPDGQHGDRKTGILMKQHLKVQITNHRHKTERD